MKETLYWTKFNKDYKQYPSLSSNEKCDVVIIGGGITGCITAYYLSTYNIDTILLEKDSIGEKSSCKSLGIIDENTELPMKKLENLIGTENAFKTNILCKKAINDLNNILYLNNCSHILKHRDFKYIADNNIYNKNCSLVNPLNLCHTLLKKSKKNNCKIFENTTAIGYDYHKNHLKIKTSDYHYVQCKKIIFTDIYSSYRLIKEWELFDFLNSYYIVTTPILENSFDALKKYLILKESNDIYTYIRPTKDNRLMLSEFNGGNDKDKASYLLSKLQDIINYSKDIKVDYYFHKTYGESQDSLPFIGIHPKFPNCYFNLALGKNNICNSLIGAEIIRDLILYKYSPYSNIFSFERH